MRRREKTISKWLMSLGGAALAVGLFRDSLLAELGGLLFAIGVGTRAVAMGQSPLWGFLGVVGYLILLGRHDYYPEKPGSKE